MISKDTESFPVLQAGGMWRKLNAKRILRAQKHVLVSPLYMVDVCSHCPLTVGFEELPARPILRNNLVGEFFERAGWTDKGQDS